MKNLKLKYLPKKINTLLAVLLLSSFLKEVVFSAVVPIWHTPDEQAHFAQVAYYLEFGTMPLKGDDLNREIWESEKILGTDRNIRGENKFTYHPEYRIEYTDNLAGKYETEIKNFPIEYRKEIVRQEATNYPPLFYWLSAIPYRLFYQADLITRVYLVRFISTILAVLTVYICYLIAKQLFPKSFLLQLTLPIMVSSQPMLSFVFSGVNSDNLMNFLFTLFLYFNILLIQKGISIKIMSLIGLNLYLLFLTKPQFLLGVPILFLSLVMSLFINHIDNKKSVIKAAKITVIGIILFALSFYGGLLEFISKRFTYFHSFSPGDNKAIEISFLDFLIQSIKRTVAETIPWYWGVFNWLGVVLPRDVNRVINRMMILAGVGVLINFLLMIKKRDRQSTLLVFLILSSLIYFMGIIFYNYLFTLSHAFSFGIQGRYFFPTIAAHMSILLIGLITLIPEKYLFLKDKYIKLIGVGFIILNLIGLNTIINSYYDTSSLNNFLVQVSQYKPDFYKGTNLLLILIYFGLSVLIFLYFYLFKVEFEQDEK